MAENTEQRLVALEVKISYQEDLIEQLNQIVTQQQLTVDTLQTRLEKLTQMVRAQSDEGIKDMNQETPPPHY